MPHFGKSLRDLDLSGQCIPLKQVSELFSESLYPLPPRLQFLSLLFSAVVTNPQVHAIYAPP